MIHNINEYSPSLNLSKLKNIVFCSAFFKMLVLPKNIYLDTGEYYIIIIFSRLNGQNRIINEQIHLFDAIGLNTPYSNPAILVFETHNDKLIKIVHKTLTETTDNHRSNFPSAEACLNNPDGYLFYRENGDIYGIRFFGVDLYYEENGFILSGKRDGKAQMNNKYIIMYNNTIAPGIFRDYYDLIEDDRLFRPLIYQCSSNSSILYSENRDLYANKLTLDEIESSSTTNQRAVGRINDYNHNCINTPHAYKIIFVNDILGIILLDNEWCYIQQYDPDIASVKAIFYDKIIGLTQKENDLFYVIYKNYSSQKNELQLCQLNTSNFQFERIQFLKHINQMVTDCYNIYFDEQNNEYLIQYKNHFVYDKYGGLPNLYHVDYSIYSDYDLHFSCDYITYNNVKEVYETEYLEIIPKVGLIRHKDAKQKQIYQKNLHREYFPYLNTGTRTFNIGYALEDTIYINKLSDIAINKNQPSKSKYVIHKDNENFYVYEDINIMSRNLNTKTLIDYGYNHKPINENDDIIILKNNNEDTIILYTSINYIHNLLKNNKFFDFNKKYFIRYNNKTYNNITDINNEIISDFKETISDTTNINYYQLDNHNVTYYLRDLIFIQKDDNIEFKPQPYFNTDIIECGLKDNKITYYEYIISNNIPNKIYDVTNIEYNFRDAFDIYNNNYNTSKLVEIIIQNDNTTDDQIKIEKTEKEISNITNYQTFNINDSTTFEYTIIDSTNVTISGTNEINITQLDNTSKFIIDATIGTFKYTNINISCTDVTNIEKDLINEIYNNNIISIKLNNSYILYINLYNNKISLYKSYKNKIVDIPNINLYNELRNRCTYQVKIDKYLESLYDLLYTNYKKTDYLLLHHYNNVVTYFYNDYPTDCAVTNKITHFYFFYTNWYSGDNDTLKIMNISKALNDDYSYIKLYCYYHNIRLQYHYDSFITSRQLYINYNTNELIKAAVIFQPNIGTNNDTTTFLQNKTLNSEILIDYLNDTGSAIYNYPVQNYNKYMPCSISLFHNDFNFNSDFIATFVCQLKNEHFQNIQNNYEQLTPIIQENDNKIIENKLKEIWFYDNISIKNMNITFYNVDNMLYVKINGQTLALLENTKLSDIIQITKYGNYKNVNEINIKINKSNNINLSNRIY